VSVMGGVLSQGAHARQRFARQQDHPLYRVQTLYKLKPRPCRVRQCFGTRSEHLGQAGCFRLPVKACRLQPTLYVPDSSTFYGSSASVAGHEQGRVNSHSRLAKNAAIPDAASVPVTGIKKRQGRKTAAVGFCGPKVSSHEA